MKNPLKDGLSVSLGAAAMLAPVPAVILSCKGTEENAKPNLITIAWTGTVCSHPPMVSVSIRPDRFSHALVEKSGCFCLNLVSWEMCRAADFCGVRSGREMDKFLETGLHPLYFNGFPAPVVAEAPAALLCRVKQRIPLGSHDLFLAEIEDVRVSPALMDEEGKLQISRANLVAYAHGEYYPLRNHPVGFFGYSVAREDVLEKRMGKSARKERQEQKPKENKERRRRG